MSKNTKENLFGILAILFLLSLVFGAFFYGAFTLTMLWHWFVVPTFHAPALGIAQAIGLSLFVGYFKGNLVKKDTKKEGQDTYEHIGQKIGEMYIRLTAVLAIGFVVSIFV
jgi:hypothetical protein